MNRAWPATLLLLGAAVAWTGPATAQSVVRGVVRSDSGSRRLLGARVRLEPIGRVAQSDLQGRYRLDSLPAGRYAGRAQAIGYRAVEFELVLGPADTLDVDIGLTPEVVRLPDLVAKAPEAKFQSAKMEELERRRQMGLGKFLTRIDLKGKEALPLSNVLRGLAGVRLVMRPSNCGGGFAAATGRGGGASNDIRLHCPASPQNLFSEACYLSVYLDGAQVWAWTQPDPPNIDDYLVGSLEGIEVYRGPSELPPQFQSTGTPCGVILLWTRTGEGS